MKIYDASGYVNVRGILDEGYPFNFLVGGRGTGKTYTALKVAREDERLFMLMRRTQSQADLISKPEFSVFKPLNADLGWNIEVTSISKYNSMFYIPDKDDEKIRHPVGYTCALSTISNMRGFDASDIQLLIYDEFIPEPTERLTFNAYTALLNAYETVNRNRELEGRPPLKLLLLSNSDRIYSDIVAGFGVGDKLLYMQETGTEELQASPELLLVRPRGEAFEEEKAKTAIYRAAAGGSFADVALHNLFPIEDRQRVGIRPLKEYKAVAMIHGMIIYRHKTDGSYYVTDKLSGAPKAYDATEADRRRFLREQSGVWRAHQRRKVYFSGIDIQTRFKDLYE